MPQRRTPGAEPARGLLKSEGHLSTGPRRKLPERLERAGIEYTFGSSDSDEDAAMSLLFWAQIVEPIGLEWLKPGLCKWWIEKSLHAVRNDPDSFRRVAKAIEEEQKHPRRARAVYFAILAYTRLYEDPSVDPEKITKQQVEKLAKRWWAFLRLIRDRNITGDFQDNYNDEREKIIAREIKNLPKQRWQDIWKRPEFADLKNATRGRKRRPKRKFVDPK